MTLKRKRGPRVLPDLPKSADSFGRRLRRLRNARGFTQTELGSLVGTTQRMIAYYERADAQRPPVQLLPALATTLKVSVDELVGHAQVRDVQAAPPSSRLWRRFRQVEKLSEADRRAVLRFVDALLAKQRLDHQRG
jgi:transcriptional regulator with XRE-family HTH domain